MKTVVLSWVVLCFVCPGVDLQAQKSKSLTSARYGLRLDGKYLGNIHSFSGGTTQAKTSKSSTRAVAKKNVSVLTNEPLAVEVNSLLAIDFYDWVTETLDERGDSRDLELLALDVRGKIFMTRHYSDANIRNVTFPTLDASSKKSANLSVTVHYDQVHIGKGGGTVKSKAKGKSQWMASNFRVEIGNLPCERVAKIESLSWSIPIVQSNIGSQRLGNLQVLGKPEVSNLTLHISMLDLKPWQNWFDEFVKGELAMSSEMSGRITFLGPKQQKELASVELQNIGGVALKHGKLEANKESMMRFEVGLSVERLILNKGK